MMDAKEYLMQVKQLTHRIKNLQALAVEYERLASSIPGQCFDRERVDGTRNLSAPFEKWVYKKIETEEEIKATELKLLQLKVEVEEAISQIDDVNLRLVLIYRYLDFYSWGEVAKKIYASIPAVYKYHQQALDKFKVPAKKL